MLQDIRDNSQGIIAKVIIALMIVPFVFFGIDSLFTSGGGVDVAEVNGEQISEAELLYGIDRQKQRLAQQLGDSYDPNVIQDSMLKPQVLESLIQRSLFKDQAKKLSVVASNKLLDKSIVESPDFQEGGVFSVARYEGLLRANGLTTIAHRQQLKTQIEASHIAGGLQGSAFATEKDLAMLATVIDERRDLRYMVVPAAKLEDIEPISTEAVQAFYDANAQQFLSEEQANVDYIEMSMQDFYQDVAEEDIRSTYDREKAAFEGGVQRNVAHIMLEINDSLDVDAASAKLQALSIQVQEGADFSKLAQEHSDDLATAELGGELGFIEEGDFPEFDSALTGLEQGQLSELIVTETAVHLLKILEANRREFADFASSHDRIEEQIKRAAAKPEFITSIEALADATFGAEDLLAGAEEFGLTVKNSDYFGRADTAGLAAHRVVRNLAFSDEFLAENGNSDVLELSEDTVVVLRLKDFKAAEAKPLIVVAEQIELQLQQEKLAGHTAARAQGFVEQLKNDDNIENLAKSNKLEWQVSLDTKRSSIAVDQAILSEAFAAQEFVGASALGVATLSNGDHAVIQVKNVQLGKLSRVPAADQLALAGSYKQSLGNSDFDRYFKSVRDQADVTIY